MIPDNVTLVVKAPNQQIEDQSVECLSSWTVGQLKGHLSEVYPSKPSKEDQKIIYSGQLLDDNTILKDVLRNYESQLAHTMHLVCSPNKYVPLAQETDGVRRRIVPETQRPAETAPRPEMTQNDQNHTVEMQNYLSSFVNNYGRGPPCPSMSQGYLPVPSDPATIANHMMMMQQYYMQYMQNYANMWQAAGNPVPAAPPVEPPPPAVEVPEAEAEDGAPGRDWLDYLYGASRFAILLSLLYLYGSPARLLLVVILAAAGYLHQIGFFRDLHLNPGNARRNLPPQNNERAGAPNRTADNPPPYNPNDDPQSLLAVTWMIFTSFFASLIPDTN